MSVVAAALRELMALGVSGDALVAAVERIEQAALIERAGTVRDAVDIATRKADAEMLAARSKGAERMARYRRRRVENGLGANFEGGRYVATLRERDGPACVYCAGEEGAVVDHMRPVSAKGTDDLDNLALACAACNCGKAGRLLSEDGREIKSPTARAAYVRYVRERVRTVRDEANETANERPSRTSARVVIPSLSSLPSEVQKEVGGGGVERERADFNLPDDWPAGKASDHVRLIVETVASPWLDPSKSPDLVTTAGRVVAWRREGASWEHDVLPVVSGICGNRRSRIASWKFFDAAIARSIADNRAALEIPEAGRVRATGPPQGFAAQIAAEHAEARRRVLES